MISAQPESKESPCSQEVWLSVRFVLDVSTAANLQQLHNEITKAVTDHLATLLPVPGVVALMAGHATDIEEEAEIYHDDEEAHARLRAARGEVQP